MNNKISENKVLKPCIVALRCLKIPVIASKGINILKKIIMLD